MSSCPAVFECCWFCAGGRKKRYRHCLNAYSQSRAVAHPGIDRRGGAPIFARVYTHHSWHSDALVGSGGMLPLKILKSKVSNNAISTIFRPKYGRFLFWWPWTGGEGACCAPSGSTTYVLVKNGSKVVRLILLSSMTNGARNRVFSSFIFNHQALHPMGEIMLDDLYIILIYMWTQRGRARYLSVTEDSHNTESLRGWRGKERF